MQKRHTWSLRTRRLDFADQRRRIVKGGPFVNSCLCILKIINFCRNFRWQFFICWICIKFIIVLLTSWLAGGRLCLGRFDRFFLLWSGLLIGQMSILLKFIPNILINGFYKVLVLISALVFSSTVQPQCLACNTVDLHVTVNMATF